MPRIHVKMAALVKWTMEVSAVNAHTTILVADARRDWTLSSLQLSLSSFLLLSSSFFHSSWLLLEDITWFDPGGWGALCSGKNPFQILRTETQWKKSLNLASWHDSFSVLLWNDKLCQSFSWRMKRRIWYVSKTGLLRDNYLDVQVNFSTNPSLYQTLSWSVLA